MRPVTLLLVLLLLLLPTPAAADELPPGAQSFAMIYSAVEVDVTTPLTFRQGEPAEIAGAVSWASTGYPVTVGLTTIILHWPTATYDEDHARAMDVAVFAPIDTDGRFAATVLIPYLLAPEEPELYAEGQFNVFTILDNGQPAFLVIGHADVWLPVVVTQ